MGRSADEADKLPHVAQEFIQAALRNERVKHFSAGLSALAEKAWVLRGVKPRLVLFVRLPLPAVFDGNSQSALIKNTAGPALRNGSDHAALMACAFFPRCP